MLPHGRENIQYLSFCEETCNCSKIDLQPRFRTLLYMPFLSLDSRLIINSRLFFMNFGNHLFVCTAARVIGTPLFKLCPAKFSKAFMSEQYNNIVK